MKESRPSVEEGRAFTSYAFRQVNDLKGAFAVPDSARYSTQRQGAEDGRVKRLTVEGAGRNAPGPFADDILTAYQAMSRWTTLRRSSQAPYRLGLWILCGG